MEATAGRKKIRFQVPSFLKRWDSLFYFAIAVILISIFHVIYALVLNHFATTYNWDYSIQYVPFAYSFYDDWKTLLMTGKFPLYSTRVFLGTDNIGSNSYYSLLDPFLIPMILFPRDFIPQYFVIATSAKFVVTAFASRAYLRYMGIKEIMSRVGAIAIAFSGYAMFMIGFPTTVSSLVYFPLLLYGLEKLIREQKPTWVVIAIFLEGITSFFNLVIVCVFGVLYAIWRFFMTIKDRDWKKSVLVMALGVASFALGLCLCAFSVIPGLRQSALTGRTASIGGAYLDMLKKSIASRDLRSFFTLMFEEIGDHPGREVIAFVSFFFPTGGFYAMPWARSGYDSWTASIFVYTPFLILFFVALIHSLMQRKWQHLLAIVCCVWLFLTQFSHFAFYLFTGNGYGRWYFVLIPLIVYYGCWGFQQRAHSNKLVPLTGAILALCASFFAYWLLEHTLKGQTFKNINGMTYWQDSYEVPSDYYESLNTPWFLYAQIAWIVFEGALLVIGNRKKWTPHFLMGALAIEAVVMGNLTFIYNGIWWLDSYFAGGSYKRETSSLIASNITGQDDGFYRTQMDTIGTKYGQHVAGVNGSSDFHSLMNFEPETFALHNQMKKPGGTISSYETKGMYNPNWSGTYMNKRFSTDFVLGYRYYVVRNDYAPWEPYAPDFYFPTANVPFGAVEMEDLSPDRLRYRVYRVSEDFMPSLGFAVGDEIYRIGRKTETSNYQTQFYTFYGGISSFRELARIEEVQLRGAMVEDGVELPDEIAVNDTVAATTTYLNDHNIRVQSIDSTRGLQADLYITNDKDLIFPAVNASYFQEGAGFFLNHYESVKTNLSSYQEMPADIGKMAIHPRDNGYFNQSKEGCYIEIKTYPDKTHDGKNTAEYNTVPRIYAIGDRYDEEGNLVKENDVLAYEFYSLSNTREADSGNSYYNSTSGTFGLWCRGKVKHIVFNYKGNNKHMGLSLQNINITCRDYAEIKSIIDPIRDGALQNVQRDVNSFTFETQYNRTRLVKTQLGYDAGWHVAANIPGQGKQSCQMLKLDGGLVGFVAPGLVDDEGNPIRIDYEMVYTTPYSNISAALWMFGVISYSGFVLGSFFLSAKKRKKELEIPADPAQTI